MRNRAVVMSSRESRPLRRILIPKEAAIIIASVIFVFRFCLKKWRIRIFSIYPRQLFGCIRVFEFGVGIWRFFIIDIEEVVRPARFFESTLFGFWKEVDNRVSSAMAHAHCPNRMEYAIRYVGLGFSVLLWYILSVGGWAKKLLEIGLWHADTFTFHFIS